ncbi:MAG: 5-oxoprolinase, partial [Nitrospirae bacterium]|nr:5-oxoprolinase [Nitrospirota bacterium]
VLLITTKGFRDMLEIGYQSRDDIFDLCIKKPEILYKNVIEIEERIDSKGNIVTPLKEESLLRKLREIDFSEYDTVAVVLLHSWRNPVHEEMVARLLKEQGLEDVLLSSAVSRQIKIITRGNATVVDAYLAPVIERYLRELREEITDVKIEFFISSGGLVTPELFKGRDALLSGPAGGVMAVVDISKNMGLKGAIGFDMGGTSTDVCRFDGEIERVYEKKINSIEIHTEMLDINTIASGGGSILSFDGERLMVGPESAGADPGPACYGFGGPLTVTDANLFTGRLVKEYMPKTFGPERKGAIDPSIVRKGFERLTTEINDRLSKQFLPEEIALGFLRIANEKMAMAIKEISISKGVDVRDYTLVCYGGAGGQHACAVASELGIREILFHPLAGLFSAYGIGLSMPVVKTSRTYITVFNRDNFEEIINKVEELYDELSRDISFHSCKILKEIDLRVKDTEYSFTIPLTDFEDMLARFRERYKRVFGFYREDMIIETAAMRVSVMDDESFFPELVLEKKDATSAEPVSYQSLFTENGWITVPVYRRDALPEGMMMEGPYLIVDDFTTIVVEEGFVAEALSNGLIRARRVKEYQSHTGDTRDDDRADPVLLEIFNSLFMGIATEMGHTLRNTAFSVNIRERLDFSCAIFDPECGLVANAPHIPVHLGSMADTVKAVLERHYGNIKQGDAYLSNNPFRGGSHLPDLTVVYPVFSSSGELLFFTAARGHHADIGGKTPGSMPPESSHIDEEGVLIDSMCILRDGCFMEDELREVFSNHTYPVRNIEQSIQDIKAQLAACRKGEAELLYVISRYGYETVRKYMAFIQKNAEMAVREALHKLLKGEENAEFTFSDFLDDGSGISVRITVQDGTAPPLTTTATIDFSGTSLQHDNDNLNAPLSVTASAVLYVLRALTGKDMPLNSGCLRPVRIIAPEGTLLNPRYPVAVASGNVETSQRIVDVLLGAFGVAAASQGTMNNLLFEVHGEKPYYETVGGGSGAMDGCDGASAVQVHMTNTKITDPEIIELRHPGVRLRRFSIRRGSGGLGRYRGGDGIIRELEFLRPATVTIISERRRRPPFGLKGGIPGYRGVNLHRDINGKIKMLPHRVSLTVKAGESVIIKTPGGGGYGTNPL